jgi:hypothetical protein
VYYRRLLSELQTLLSSTNSKKLVRLLLYHPDESLLKVALPLLLAHIRSHGLPVVVMVSIQPWNCEDQVALRLLRRNSDVVLETEGFASRGTYPPPAEFRSLHGLLKIRKVATSTAATSSGHFADMTTTRRPAAFLYGLKRDRRKLHIQLLHIPPEEFAADGGSVGGAVRSGAGRTQTEAFAKQATTGCSSRTEGSPLDF